MILLAEIPAYSWLGLGVTVVLGLLVYLLKDKDKRSMQRMDNLEEGVTELTDKLEAEKLNTERSLRVIDGKVNELHITILNRLDELKDTFRELRK